MQADEELGAVVAAVSRPICRGDAARRVAAVRGIASLETSDPLSEVVRALQ
ncbi:hypothetical protein [Thermostaphylospora chromogena]|uniref:hypothetical protein n=1 Tax=Thermostaphylospora chromogena TaxID=35622 RepID=UPI001F604907|nr:hypothetical protein [Thermostaphylospora chromogena]